MGFPTGSTAGISTPRSVLMTCSRRPASARAIHDVEINTATERGRPDRAIVAYAAENGFDAIVIGARGRSDLAGVLLGSVAEKVARRSPVPITVIR